MKRHRIKLKKRLKRSRLYRKCKGFLSGFASLIFIVIFAVPAIAAEAKDAGEKLVEGIEETATGWVEVPKEIAETSEETNPIEGVTIGTIKGAGEAIVETTEGAVKAATFYIPEEEKKEEE